MATHRLAGLGGRRKNLVGITLVAAMSLLPTGCSDDGLLKHEEIPTISDIDSPMAQIEVRGSNPVSARAHLDVTQRQAHKWDRKAVLIEVTCLAFLAASGEAKSLVWCYVFVDHAQAEWLGVYAGHAGILYVGRGKREASTELFGLPEWTRDTDDAHMQLILLREDQDEQAVWVEKRIMDCDGTLEYRPTITDAATGDEIVVTAGRRRILSRLIGRESGTKMSS